MDDVDKSIRTNTLEALARSFHEEGRKYGLKQVDYVRFVGVLLDMTLKADGRTKAASPQEHEGGVAPQGGRGSGLPLEGDLVHIVPFEAQRHSHLLQTWVDDPIGRNFLLSRTSASRYPVATLTEHPQTVLGVILASDTEAPVGAVAFLNTDKVNRKAELRKIIGVPGRRRGGFAREATQLWLDYGWRTLGLNKVFLNTLQINLRNIQLNQELGFSVEGVLKDEVFFDGGFHDVLRMSLFAP